MWKKILGVVVLLIVAYAAGRFTTPAKVETHEVVKYQTKIEYQDKVVTKTEVVTQKVYVHDSNSHQHTNTTTTEVTKPDGTKVKTTVTSTDTDKQSKTNVNSDTSSNKDQTKVANKTENTTKESEKSSVTTYEKNDWHISLLAGVDVTKFNATKISVDPLSQIKFGGAIDRRIVGPVYVGAFGLSDGTVGLTLSLGF